MKEATEVIMLNIIRLIILLCIAGVIGYCGGRENGFHKLLKYFGLD